ncbi:MAG: hypothetical protein A2Y17_06425 [Clostridiales bacterium GWF2_38_85]|nr:MAG: hypothetical protein A2Y17_06425 [Clostridiales bacterium GWF2_38_85]HBL84507.1 hypothetical protein [Clostridiales bacterium]
MPLLHNIDTNINITTFVSLEVGQELIRTEQKLLSGEVYIQRIGEPTVYYNVVVYVDRAGKAQLMDAEDTIALLKVIVQHGTYYGRITELKFSERMAGDRFEATLTLVKEELTT